MSNQPDRYEKFVVPEGVPKIDYVKDTKIANAGTFIIQREDHTVGNLLRMQLHRDEAVTFAGYRVPHPLEYTMHVKVQTNGSKSPVVTMAHVLQDLQIETKSIEEQFEAGVRAFKQ